MKSLREKLEGKGIYLAIIILALILVGYLINNSNSYEVPIKNYIEGMSKADSKVLFKALPEFSRRELLKEKTYKEYDEELLDEVKDIKEEYGNDFKVTYKVIDKESISREDLDEVIEDLEDEYDIDVKISDGYKLKVSITIKGSKKEDTDELDFEVYKINNTWSLSDI